MYLEKIVSRYLNRFPTSKRIVRFIYQLLLLPLGWMKTRQLNKSFHNNVYGSKHSFVGYYDVKPVDSGRYVYHRYNNDKILHPNKFTEVDIILSQDNCEIKIGSTPCFNWQQGARVTWYDNDTVLYNAMQNNKPVTVIFNVSSKKSKLIEGYHYQSHSFNYLYFLDYYYIATLRADYGYFNNNTQKVTNGDQAIYYMKISDPYPKKLLSTERVKKYLNLTDNVSVKINHVMPSPDGTSIIFILRIFERSGRKGVLMHYNHETDSLQQLSPIGLVSHLTWQNNETVFGFFETLEYGLCYQSVNINTLGRDNYSWINKVTGGDGHPVFLTENCLVTDTYPDRFRIQKLFLIELEGKTVTKIYENWHPLKFSSELRCDFHPKKIDNQTVSIDTIISNKRRIVEIDITQV